MSVRQISKRVGPTFAANIFNQGVVILSQVALVPLLLFGWGTERYGVWLLLSAIPTYLTLSDFGFTFIAKNEMTIKMVQGDQAGALRVFQSIFVLLILIAAAILAAVYAIVELFNLRDLFTLGNTPEDSAKLVLLCLAGNVVLTQFFLLQCAAVRSAGRPAAEVVWAALARLSEGAVTGICAWSGGGMVGAAMAIVLSRIIFCGLMALWLVRIAPWLRWGYKLAGRDEISRLFHPSVSYMFVSIANALVIQGPVVVLGALAQPETVVLFSTSRTLARLGTSAANLVNFSLSPEYSRLFGGRDSLQFLKLTQLHGLVGLIGIGLYVTIISLAGDWIMAQWTHGKVAVIYPFFLVLNLAVAAEMMWGAIITPLAAINRHTRLAYSFVLLASGAIALGALLVRPFGLVGVTAPILAAHGVMVVLAVLEFERRRPWRVPLGV